MYSYLYTETRIIQCKMEIHGTIYYCGMNSNISILSNGENEYINDVSRSACQDVHKTGILNVSEPHIVHGIKVNQTVTHSIILAGYLNEKENATEHDIQIPSEHGKM